MSDLRERILTDIRVTPSPTRQERRRRVASIWGLAVATGALLFFGTGGFAGGGRPPSFVIFTTFSAGLVGALLVRLAAPQPRMMLGRARSFLLIASAFGLGMIAVVSLATAVLWSDLPVEPVGLDADVACAALTFLQAAVPLGALMILRSRTDPVHPAVTGAVLGCGSGAIAASMAYLRCPHTAVRHLLSAHVAPSVALLAFGAAIGILAVRLRTK